MFSKKPETININTILNLMTDKELRSSKLFNIKKSVINIPDNKFSMSIPNNYCAECNALYPVLEDKFLGNDILWLGDS